MFLAIRRSSAGRTTCPFCHIFRDDWDASYIDDAEKTTRTRLMEHKRNSLGISTDDHKDHSITLEYTKISSVNYQWFERGVKEAIYIRSYKTLLKKK